MCLPGNSRYFIQVILTENKCEYVNTNFLYVFIKKKGPRPRMELGRSAERQVGTGIRRLVGLMSTGGRTESMLHCSAIVSPKSLLATFGCLEVFRLLTSAVCFAVNHQLQ